MRLEIKRNIGCYKKGSLSTRLDEKIEYFEKYNVHGNLQHLHKPETSEMVKIYVTIRKFPDPSNIYDIAAIDLKPGKLVPTATKLMAVTEAFSPTVHPSPSARSPIIAVIIPMKTMDTMKAAQPCQ